MTLRSALAEGGRLDDYQFSMQNFQQSGSVFGTNLHRTLKQLHLELRALGYEGSYDRVAAFARGWKVDQLERGNSASKSTSSYDDAFIETLALGEHFKFLMALRMLGLRSMSSARTSSCSLTRTGVLRWM